MHISGESRALVFLASVFLNRASTVARINVLELQAVVNSVKWRLRRSDNLDHRVMLLLDSQVICAVIVKGHTSSHRLQHSLKVLNALC